MHVNDFTALKVLVEEVNDGVLCFCYRWQEFILTDLSISSVPFLHILNLLFLLGFEFFHSLCAKSLQDCIIAIGIEIRIAILLLILSLLLNNLILVLSLSLFHFFLHLRSLVLDCLLHYHFVEDISSNLHACAGHASSSVSLCHFKFRDFFLI